MEAIRREHDRDLTYNPVLSKKSSVIAHNRYQSDLDKSQVAIAEMAQKDQAAIGKVWLNEKAKKTLRKR